MSPTATHGMTNVADIVARHAAERPSATAIIDSDITTDYKTFDALIWAAVWHLHRAGIKPGDVVGLGTPRTILYVVAYFALARMGAIGISLPSSDPYVLREALVGRFGVHWILTGGEDPGLLGAASVAISMDVLKQAPARPQTELRVQGGDTVWAIRRTSGTTGEPKGVERTHAKSLLNYHINAAFHPQATDRVLAVLDLATAFAFSAVERAFFGGAALILPPKTLDVAEFFSCIERYAITHISLTANFFTALLPYLPTDSCRYPHLTTMMSGMAMPEVLRAEIRRRFTPNLVIYYGSNEAQGLTMANAQQQIEFPETVGSALPGVELQIVDENDQPVPAGEPGEIRARTTTMASGYLNAPERAGRTFRNGWIYLGDVGVLSAEGMLFVKGRLDDMMNFDGIKIMPVDIEDTLLQHPAVSEAVAFPIASKAHQNLPAAAVILRQTISGDELLAYCRKHLGLRAPVILSVEKSFPRNAGGKILRAEIAAGLAGRLPTLRR